MLSRRLALSFSLGATVAVAGCAGSNFAFPPDPPAQLRAMLRTAEASQSAGRRDSWMLPEARSEDLLYNSYGKVDVRVYSYPSLKLVGTLSGFDGPLGMCSDKHGNIWITNYYANTIVEYSHGGTVPLATLKVPEESPRNCSVDPSSGNLAVAGRSAEQHMPGAILVYLHARGVPQTHWVPHGNPEFCGYDNKGNLFMTGADYSKNIVFVLTELPKGEKRAKDVSIESAHLPANYPTPIQWDGNYFAVGGVEGIYRYHIRHYIAVQIGYTGFNHVYQITNAWIQDGKAILYNIGGSRSPLPSVQIDKWPAGGNPIRTLQYGGFGLTVSGLAK